MQSGLSLAAKMLLLMGKTWPPAGVTAIYGYWGFTTPHAAPLTSPHTEILDGDPHSVGSLTLDQTGGNISTSSGNMNLPANSGAWGDLGYWDATAYTRAPGLAFLQRFTVSTWEEYGFGWDTNVGDDDPDNFENAIQLNTTDGRIDDVTGVTLITGLATATEYAASVILRTTGNFAVLYTGTQWELLQVYDTGATGTLYAVGANLDAVLTIATADILGLDTGNATIYPTPLVGDTFSHIPTIEDRGSNGLDATPNYVGLDGSNYHFDGSKSYIQLNAAGIEAAGWDDATGIAIIELSLATVSGTGAPFNLGADASNRLYISQSNDTLNVIMRVGGVNEQQALSSLSADTIYRIGVIWTGGNVRFYLDGVEQGSAQAIAGTWAGVLTDTWSVLGSATNAPAGVWAGYISGIVISLNADATDGEMQTLTNQSNALTTTLLDANIGAGDYVYYDSSEIYLSDGTLLNADTGFGNNINFVSDTWSNAGGVAYCGPDPGDNQIVNGTFAADSDWTKGAGWSIAAGVATHAAGSASNLTATVAPLVGYSFHKVTYTVSGRTAGSVYVRCGSSWAGVTRSTNATFTEVIFADGTAFAFIADAAFDGSVDNVSARELTFADLVTTSDQELEYAYVRSAVSIDDGYYGGVILRTNANRDQGIFARIERNDSTGDVVIIADRSTMQLSSMTGVTYSDGATLEAAYRSDGKVWVYYNGALVQADSVTVDPDSFQSGLFGTGSPNGESNGAEVWQVNGCSGLDDLV